MSETARSYSRYKGGPGTGFSTRATGRFRIFPWLLVLAVVLSVAGLWFSRDSQPVHSFVHRNATFLGTAPNYLDSRERVANSPIWDAFPEESPWSKTPEALTDRIGLPTWIYRNFAPGALHVWCNDTENFADTVIVSRMSRVGTIVERVHRLLPGKDVEWAGGLRIHYRRSLDWHYAVRGRVLIAARSRNALIRALTLSTDEQWKREDLQQAVAAGAEDVRGVLRSQQEGSNWSRVRFAVRIEADEALARLDTELSDDGRDEWAPLLTASRPQRFSIPAETPASAAFHLDVPLSRVWSTIGAGTDWPFFSPLQWRAWNRGEIGPAAAWLTSLTENTDATIEASWYGFDVDASYPVPLVSGISRTRNAAPLDELFAALGESAYDLDTWEPLPHQIENAALIPLRDFQDSPLILERNEGVVAFRVASPMPYNAAAESDTSQWQSEGHLVFRFSPTACAEQFDLAGQFLAPYGLVSGHTRESFQQFRRDREERLAHVDDVGVSVITSRDGLSIQVQATLNP